MESLVKNEIVLWTLGGYDAGRMDRVQQPVQPSATLGDSLGSTLLPDLREGIGHGHTLCAPASILVVSGYVVFPER